MIKTERVKKTSRVSNLITPYKKIGLKHTTLQFFLQYRSIIITIKGKKKIWHDLRQFFEKLSGCKVLTCQGKRLFPE